MWRASFTVPPPSPKTSTSSTRETLKTFRASLKLEGEVLLEVDFRATGQVRVLQVVRGLGHGLDEEATRAAERIQFKPAQSRGEAIDFRATVHITFRLT